MAGFEDHPLRYALAGELHARPFPALEAPSHAVFLAVKQPENAAGRDRDADFRHLSELLDQFGAPRPKPGATHYFGRIGQHKLKWESHSEFVTYTIFVEGNGARPFDAAAFSVFPEQWLAAMPGKRLTSALIRIELRPPDEEIRAKINEWFVPESTAAVEVLDRSAVVGGDFRIDAAGHLRFAVFAGKGISARRIGRIVQRLSEIETYKTMAMLGHARVRNIGAQIGAVDKRLRALVQGLGGGGGGSGGNSGEPERDLAALLALSGELEGLLAQTSFRFGATKAYEAIVHQRIEVLREERFAGRQTLNEFMMRRFDPAMRTVKATEHQLEAMAARTERAGNLLRTRVDVERSAQNQKVLESMDRRADMQLRLQETVEGLSVVAISYYAVSLVAYLVYPLVETLGISKGNLIAALVLPVVGAVWLMVRRIRRRAGK